MSGTCLDRVVKSSYSNSSNLKMNWPSDQRIHLHQAHKSVNPFPFKQGPHWPQVFYRSIFKVIKLSSTVSIFLYRDPRLNCRVLSLSPFHIRGYTDFVSFQLTFKMSFVFSLTSRIAQVQRRIIQSSPPDCINLEVEIERNRCHVIRVRLALIGRSCSFLISCCSAAPSSSCCYWRHEWRRRKEREAQVVNKQEDFSLEESGYYASSSHSVHRRTNGV